MNKVVIGCLASVVILGTAGAIGAYYFVWRPAKSYVVELSKLKEIPQLNQNVRKTTSFTPPADSVLTPESVERFVRTQQSIQATLGQRANELAAKYKFLDQGREANRRPSWNELVSAYRDFAGLILDAKRAQVEALNQNDYSVAEYEWTRRSIYEATDIPINPDLEKTLWSIAQGKASQEELKTSASPRVDAAVLEKNRAVVQPHLKGLADRAALAAFGL